MKKTLLSALLILSTSAFAADETKLFPFFDEDYAAEPKVALMIGHSSNQDDATPLPGIELTFACPVFQIEGLKINQILSLTHSSIDGYDITSIEMNPKVVFDIMDKTTLGVGPGFGILVTNHGTEYGFNLGASIDYDIIENYFVGVETRHQWATENELDNTRILLKAGMHF